MLTGLLVNNHGLVLGLLIWVLVWGISNNSSTAQGGGGSFKDRKL